MIDSTAVLATCASSGARKKGAAEPANHVLGRNPGALTTKIHILSNANGVSLRFLLTSGHASNISYAQPCWTMSVFQQAKVAVLTNAANWLLADKDYDAEALRGTSTGIAYSPSSDASYVVHTKVRFNETV